MRNDTPSKSLLKPLAQRTVNPDRETAKSGEVRKRQTRPIALLPLDSLDKAHRSVPPGGAQPRRFTGRNLVAEAVSALYGAESRAQIAAALAQDGEPGTPNATGRPQLRKARPAPGTKKKGLFGF